MCVFKWKNVNKPCVFLHLPDCLYQITDNARKSIASERDVKLLHMEITQHPMFHYKSFYFCFLIGWFSCFSQRFSAGENVEVAAGTFWQPCIHKYSWGQWLTIPLFFTTCMVNFSTGFSIHVVCLSPLQRLTQWRFRKNPLSTKD